MARNGVDWLSIAALFVINAADWWVDPFAWTQLISWGLLLASIVPVVWGLVLLAHAGKPTSSDAIRGAAKPAKVAIRIAEKRPRTSRRAPPTRPVLAREKCLCVRL